jgi:hypothetical protein
MISTQDLLQKHTPNAWFNGLTAQQKLLIILMRERCCSKNSKCYCTGMTSTNRVYAPVTPLAPVKPDWTAEGTGMKIWRTTNRGTTTDQNVIQYG